MTQSQNIYKKFPFFYGWIIVAASALGMVFSIPGQTIGVSVFTDYLIEVLGLSRDQLSLAYMIGTLSSAAILSFSGFALDRWGSRKFGIIVSILLGSVLIGLSFIDSAVAAVQNRLASVNPAISAMVLMSLGFFLLRFLGQGSMTLVSRNLPMRWFTRRRGLVSAIVGTVVSFGFNAAPTLYDMLIQASGWKGAWRISGLVVLTVGTALFAIVVRENPESVGLTQDGMAEREPETDAELPLQPGETSKVRQRLVAINEPEMTLAQALKTIKFWVFGLSVGLSSLYTTGFTFHVVSIFTEAGIDRAVAVWVFIPISLISVVLNAVVSTASDHVKLKWILAVLLAGLMLSMVCVTFLAPGGLFTWLIIIGNGLTGGTFSALTTLVWPRFYGTKHLGSISGFAMGILVAGSALGPIMLSVSLSLAGSYANASMMLAFICALLFISAVLVKEDSPRRSA